MHTLVNKYIDLPILVEHRIGYLRLSVIAMLPTKAVWPHFAM